MLGEVQMKTIRLLMLLATLPFVAVSCGGTTETGGVDYEPIYLNESDVQVAFTWYWPAEETSGDTAALLGTFMMQPQDTVYCSPGGKFPLLDENGLRWSEKDPLYDVRLVFDGEPKRCLDFTGESLVDNDIRDIASYENTGECNFCVMRTMSIPYGMLYRITEEMRASAGPCE